MPAHFDWHDVDSWPDRERLDDAGLAALCARLSVWFGPATDQGADGS